MSAVVESLNQFQPAAAPRAATSSALAQQQREVAETQVKYMMAERFPRDPVRCMDEILNAFTRPRLAEAAQYQYAKGGSEVSGPSIRSAEAIAQLWGNIEFGFKEVARGVGVDGISYSEVEAYAHDLQRRTRKPLQFIVRHWRDTRKGGHPITDEREIYELMANMAQRRVRACILAVIPGDVVEAAMEQADVTLRAKADVTPEAQHKMVEAFATFGVSKEQIEKRIQRRLDAIQPAQMVTLKRIYASLRDGMSGVGEWFEVDGPPASASEAVADLNQRVKQHGAAAPKTAGAPTNRTPAASADDAGADGDALPYTVAQFIDAVRMTKTEQEVDAFGELVGSYPVDVQPELMNEVGRARKRIAAGAKK